MIEFAIDHSSQLFLNKKATKIPFQPLIHLLQCLIKTAFSHLTLYLVTRYLILSELT